MIWTASRLTRVLWFWWEFTLFRIASRRRDTDQMLYRLGRMLDAKGYPKATG